MEIKKLLTAQIGPKPKETKDQARLLRSFKSGALWFFWIGGLSVVNTIVLYMGSEWRMVIGLGITTILDVIGYDHPEYFILASIFSIAISGCFVFFGWRAIKGKRWPFVVGSVLYLLDIFILVALEDYIGVAFHAWGVFGISTGYMSFLQLRKIK